MTVGERIRTARKSVGLTQKQVGEGSGIAETTIRRYELGDLNPKFSTLAKIASVLGVSPLYLSGYSDSLFDDNIPDPERERFLIRTYEEHLHKTMEEFGDFLKRVNQLDSSHAIAGYFSYLGDIAEILDSINLMGWDRAKQLLKELAETPEYKKKDPPAH